MNATGLQVFDKTIQTTHIWLDEIGEALDPDKQRQYDALRAVLFALRDRLTIEEAFHLSAQLPMLVRGIWWEGYRPVHKPERYRSLDEFLEKVSENLQGIAPMDPEAAAHAVFAVLARHLSPGEFDEVKQMLPEPVRRLFPQGPRAS